MNEPPAAALLPVRESILTKDGFIVATGSVACENGEVALGVKRGRARRPSPSLLKLSVAPSLSSHLWTEACGPTQCAPRIVIFSLIPRTKTNPH